MLGRIAVHKYLRKPSRIPVKGIEDAAAALGILILPARGHIGFRPMRFAEAVLADHTKCNV